MFRCSRKKLQFPLILLLYFLVYRFPSLWNTLRIYWKKTFSVGYEWMFLFSLWNCVWVRIAFTVEAMHQKEGWQWETHCRRSYLFCSWENSKKEWLTGLPYEPCLQYSMQIRVTLTIFYLTHINVRPYSSFQKLFEDLFKIKLRYLRILQ